MKKLLLAIVICSLGFSLFADLDFFELSLDDLLNVQVVTASRSAQKSSDAPATIYTITAAQIRTRGYQSLQDVLNDIPEFKIDRNHDTEMQDIFSVRGLDGQSKIMILLDGAKISAAANENMPIFENYPVHFAQQIEVVIGPASALYGADAVSGVINIISKTPNDNDKPVYVSGNIGMYNTYNTSMYYGKKINDNASIFVAGQYFYDEQPNLSEYYEKEFAGIDSLGSGTFNTNWGPMTPSPVNSEYGSPKYAYNIFAKLNYDNFTFSLFKNYSRVSSSTSYTPNNAIYNKDVYFEQSIGMVSASHSKDFGSLTNTTTLTVSTYDMLPDSHYRNIYVGLERGYKYATSQMTKIEEQLIWQYNDKLTFTTGLSYDKYFAIPRSNDLHTKIVEEEGIVANMLNTDLKADFYTSKSHNIGSYLQAQISFNEKVSATIGSRYDYNSRYKSSFNPRLGLVLNPFTRTNIKFLYGSAFLAPSPAMAFLHFGSFYYDQENDSYFSYYTFVPNPDLKPIKSQNFEMSFRQYLTSNLSLTSTGYFTKLTDLFAAARADKYYSETDSVFYYNGHTVYYMETNTNLGEQKIFGATFKLDYLKNFGKSNRINTYIAYTYTDGEVDLNDDGKYIEIPYITPMSVKAGAEITFNRLTIYPSLLYVGTQNQIAMKKIKDNEGVLIDTNKRKTIDGYTLVNMTTRYNFNSNYTAYFKILNAFDSRYKNVNLYNGEGAPEFKDGSPQNPIRFILGAEFNF